MPCDWPNKPSMLGLGPLRRDCARKALSLIKPWQLQREDDGCSTFLRMVARLDQGSSVLIGSLAHSLSKLAETERRKQNRHRILKPENDCRHHQLTSWARKLASSRVSLPYFFELGSAMSVPDREANENRIFRA